MSDLVRLAMPHIEKFENAKHRQGWRPAVKSLKYGPDYLRALIVFQCPDDPGLRKEEEWELRRYGRRIEGYLMSASLILGDPESGRIDAPDALLSPAPVLLIEFAADEESSPA